MWLPGGDQCPRTEQAGLRSSSDPLWSRGKGICLPYDGPPLAWLLRACKAPDGSYWALQSWVRLKRNYGGTTAGRRAPSLPLARTARRARRLPELGRAEIPPPVRPAHVPRCRRLRVHGHRKRRPARQLRPQRLPRHLRLPLREEAGIARTASSRIIGARRWATSVTASSRTSGIRPGRGEVPRDRGRSGSDARRDVGGERRRPLQQGHTGSDASPGAELGRPEVPHLTVLGAP